MTLSEKIYYCRKKAGKSQEALAEQLGVSRQAVSKWETGEAEPEIRKLQLLAAVFGVSTDWLLSEDPPQEASQAEPSRQEPPQQTHSTQPDWASSLPGLLGKLARRYGWLCGVYIALSGGGVAFIGLLARVLSRSMFSSFSSVSNQLIGSDPFSPFGGNAVFYDASGLPIDSPFSSAPMTDFATNNPVYLLGTVLLVAGLLVAAGGAVLAIVLKKRGGKGA